MYYGGYDEDDDENDSSEVGEELEEVPDESGSDSPIEQDPRSMRIEAALKSIPEYTFATITQYQSTPNPMLSLDGVGKVGIPFINTKPSPQSFWKATIENPAWDHWFQSRATVLGEKLGVKGAGASFASIATTDVNQISLLNSPESNAAGQLYLLVILPTFEIYRLSIAHPSSGEEVYLEANTKEKASSTTVAAFFKGALPSIVSADAVVLLYHLARPYVQAVLPLTGLPGQDLVLLDSSRQRATLESNIRELLAAKASNPNDSTPPFITWLLSRSYSSGTAMQGLDARQTDLLKEVALKLGLKAYLAQVQYEIDGTPSGWEDPNEMEEEIDYYDYYDRDHNRRTPSPELEEDENGDYILDEVDGSSIDLSKWTDLVLGIDLPTNVVSYQFSEGIEILPYGWKDSLGKSSEQDYDKQEGHVTQTWFRTAVVLWAEDKHPETLAKIFQWRCAWFLEPTLWPAESSINNRVLFTERALRVLPPISYSSTQTVQAELNKARDMLLNLTVEANRPNMYLDVIRKFGAPDNLDVARKAAATFAAQGNDAAVTVLAEESLRRESGIIKRLGIVASFFPKGAPEIKNLVSTAMAGGNGIYPKELTAPVLLRLGDVFGLELVRSHIIPKIQSYADTDYWITLLRQFQPDPALLEAHLLHVVNAHKIEFTIRGGTQGYTGSYYGSTLSSYGDVKNDPSKRSPVVLSMSALTRKLLIFCLESKALDDSEELLKKISQADAKTTDKPARRKFFLELLRDVHSYLRQYAITVASRPSLIVFFREILLKFVLPELGPRPEIDLQPNYQLPALRCNCNFCRPISLFLLSQHQKKASWRATKAERHHFYNHIEARPDVTSKLKISRISRMDRSVL